MPTENVLQKDEEKLKFRWKSPRTIYSLIFLFFCTLECIFGTRRLIRLGMYNIHFAETFMFFITAIVKFLIMFRLGRNWKDIMVKWRSFENVFLQHPYTHKGLKLKIRVRCVAAFFFVFMLGNKKIISLTVIAKKLKNLKNKFAINLFKNFQPSTSFSSPRPWRTIN